ncbi:MAG: hypothetical protein JNM07_08750 [Phycisphaerae bacterium]|nr:hypothetical protein [Phycisphaerae bacterium]
MFHSEVRLKSLACGIEPASLRASPVSPWRCSATGIFLAASLTSGLGAGESAPTRDLTAGMRIATRSSDDATDDWTVEFLQIIDFICSFLGCNSSGAFPSLMVADRIECLISTYRAVGFGGLVGPDRESVLHRVLMLEQHVADDPGVLAPSVRSDVLRAIQEMKAELGSAA